MNMHATLNKPSQAAAAVPAAGGRRLLVVGGGERLRSLAEALAGGFGFAVDFADDASGAMGLLPEGGHDAVIVDLSAGGRGGVEVVGAIARGGSRPDIVVVSEDDDHIGDVMVRFARSAGLSVVGRVRAPVQAPELGRCLANVAASVQRRDESVAALRIPVEDLRAAIAGGEVYPVYQPQVALATSEIVGVEALARWRSAVHGDVPPAAFVEIAERNGLAKDLTMLMLRKVVADAKPWCDAVPDLRVAVNVSATVLSDLDFPDRVIATLRGAGMDPRNLVIEVTERTALADAVNNGDVMSRLSIEGVRLSLDDFGTGNASLRTLESPFDEIKIDRGFTQEAYRDPSAWTIIQATIALAKARSMRVVAEGIETQVVGDLLRQHGVECGQGYFHGKPMTAAEIADRLSPD